VSVTLVGDAIENPANALTMVHASQMFGAACRFRDTKGLAATCSGQGFLTASSSDVRALHARIVACDNLPGAKDVFGFEAGHDFALLVGNERRGLSHEFATMATDRVQVPMHSRRVNCLNVAAASAVGLYYLCGSKVGAIAVRKDPASRRPDILLYQPADHFELAARFVRPRRSAGAGPFLKIDIRCGLAAAAPFALKAELLLGEARMKSHSFPVRCAPRLRTAA
jgi:tRNA C32,U32 (ribose-2'-O)-methylase TrmJ